MHAKLTWLERNWIKGEEKSRNSDQTTLVNWKDGGCGDRWIARYFELTEEEEQGGISRDCYQTMLLNVRDGDSGDECAARYGNLIANGTRVDGEQYLVLVTSRWHLKRWFVGSAVCGMHVLLTWCSLSFRRYTPLHTQENTGDGVQGRSWDSLRVIWEARHLRSVRDGLQGTYIPFTNLEEPSQTWVCVGVPDIVGRWNDSARTIRDIPVISRWKRWVKVIGERPMKRSVIVRMMVLMKSRLKDNFAFAVVWQSGDESRNQLSVLTVIASMNSFTAIVLLNSGR